VPSQTPQPIASPSEQATSSHFPTETAVMVAVVIAVIVTGLAFAFKIGYLAIEVIEVDKSQETSCDYSI
jgi:cell division protein FtsN